MKTLRIYTDGSYLRGWLGYAAVCLWDNRRHDVYGRMRPNGETSPQLAELLAVKLALASVSEKKRAEWEVYVFSDCQGVVNALLGHQNPRDLVDHLPEVKELMAQFASCELVWQRKNESRWNRYAHALANAARWGRIAGEVVP